MSSRYPRRERQRTRFLQASRRGSQRAHEGSRRSHAHAVRALLADPGARIRNWSNRHGRRRANRIRFGQPVRFIEIPEEQEQEYMSVDTDDDDDQTFLVIIRANPIIMLTLNQLDTNLDDIIPTLPIPTIAPTIEVQMASIQGWGELCKVCLCPTGFGDEVCTSGDQCLKEYIGEHLKNRMDMFFV
jgi:hypothetical protein